MGTLKTCWLCVEYKSRLVCFMVDEVMADEVVAFAENLRRKDIVVPQGNVFFGKDANGRSFCVDVGLETGLLAIYSEEDTLD